MPDTEDVVRDAVLRAVGGAVERAWDTDRFALAGGLRAALAEETALPPGDAVRRVFQRYGTALTGLVLRYAGPGPGAPVAPADREDTRIALHDTVAALVADLVALGLVAPAGTQTPDDGPYESPSVHEAAHEVAHVVAASARPAPGACPGASLDGGDGPSGGRDRSPGAAARRRARRAGRALQEARRTLEDLDWEAVADVNRALLAALKPRQRLSLLWAEHPGRLVVGTANPAHAALSALTAVPGAGVFAGSVQRGAGTGPLRRTPTAQVTGLPGEAGEAVAAAFAAYGFRVTLRAPTPWDT